jgi:hypothetical protein
MDCDEEMYELETSNTRTSTGIDPRICNLANKSWSEAYACRKFSIEVSQSLVYARDILKKQKLGPQ